MPNNASLDTNCLLRWLLWDLPDQAVAVDKALCGDRKYDVADAAVIEMVFVLEKVYSLPRTIIRDFVLVILSRREINSNKVLFNVVIEDYVKHPALSFMDCFLAGLAELSGAIPLLTFDKKLAHQLDSAELLPL